MKFSLKVQDQHKNFQPHFHNPQNPLLLRAKIPISVFGFPFLSGLTGTDSSDVCFSLSTNFLTGPSVKLSYTPTSTTRTGASASAATPPLTLTLKSGVSFFGSPLNSPLVISAHCTFSPQNPNPIFSLQFKPQFGNFSLCKTTYSAPNPNPNPKANGEVNSIGFGPLERPTVWKDLSHLTMESCSGKDSILSGIAVRARTELPVTKRVAVNLRWGVNFPADFGKQLPFLSVNKIGIERIDEVKEVKELSVKRNESSVDDLKLLKGMCFWMRSELDALQEENREMKHRLEEMISGQSARNYSCRSDSVGKSTSPPVENSGGFEQWRNKKNGGKDNGRKESKKSVNRASDVESELERAIKAASSL